MKRMYIVSGETDSSLITRALWAYNPEEGIARIKRVHGGIRCLNIDLYTVATAKSYGIPFTNQPCLHIRPKAVVNPCAEISMPAMEKRASKFYGWPTHNKDPIAFKEEFSMYNTSKPLVYRPVIVRGVDILDATQAQLASLVRDLTNEILKDKDLASVSTVFAAEAKEIRDAIKLVLEQIDKEVK
jgi:hypothetical protein